MLQGFVISSQCSQSQGGSAYLPIEAQLFHMVYGTPETLASDLPVYQGNGLGRKGTFALMLTAERVHRSRFSGRPLTSDCHS